jgi:hypothetical protein
MEKPTQATMERPDEYYTTDTYATDIEDSVRIFAALHQGIADPEDRCVSLAVGQSNVTFEAEVARGLGTMLLRAADVLESVSERRT